MTAPEPLRFDRFYRYDELTAHLRRLVEAHPDKLALESIGKSYQGRDIWLVTATRFASGAPADKPGYWVDASIHATELAPSTLALMLIHRLATIDEDDIQRCLDQRVFYIVPRVNPDGAEVALADRPRFIRSSVRLYPHTDEPDTHLAAEDIDGDGRILQMRIKDPHGAYKKSPKDPRLLVLRDPIEEGGTYYRLLPEGFVSNFDGCHIPYPGAREGLDLNRNFPGRWRGQGEQPGAGEFPTSEPEVRTLVEAIKDRPNICGSVHLHTYSGVLLRPPATRSDDSIPPSDRRTYEIIGAKGTSLTGYPAINLYRDFRYHPTDNITGVQDDWMYEDMGVFSWTTELWSPRRMAGIEEGRWIDWHRDHPHEDDLKLLGWADAELGDRGYVPWYRFEHPQLGEVELGGWDYLRVILNPPAHLLEKEVRPHVDWIVWNNLVGPRLVVLEASLTPMGGDVHRLRLVVQNAGWLPTHVTRRALEKKAVRAVRATLTLPPGGEILTGRARQELGQLEGRNTKLVSNFGPLADPTDDRARAEWTVKIPAGTSVTWEVRHDRAGTLKGTLTAG